jgi:uncharacterized protein YjbI with pentapeptide repeats
MKPLKTNIFILVIISFFIFFRIISILWAADSKISIAVLDFEGKDISRSVAEKVSELIRIEMVDSTRITVIERNRIDKILKEQGLQHAGLTEKSNIVKVGTLLAANKILYGTVMKLGGKIVITGQIVNVEKGNIEFANKQEVSDEKELYQAASVFSMNLISKMTGSAATVSSSSGAKADGPNYIGANLARTDFEGKNLEGVNFKGADLTRADLENAILNKGDLRGANLERADLEECSLIDANLTGANLTRANLQKAKLNGAILIKANLERADLEDADLTNSKLSEANLERANFQNAKLKGADMQKANLTRADLEDADISDVKFTGAVLFRTQIDKKWKVYILKQNVQGYNKIIWE